MEQTLNATPIENEVGQVQTTPHTLTITHMKQNGKILKTPKTMIFRNVYQVSFLDNGYFQIVGQVKVIVLNPIHYDFVKIELEASE